MRIGYPLDDETGSGRPRYWYSPLAAVRLPKVSVAASFMDIESGTWIILPAGTREYSANAPVSSSIMPKHIDATYGPVSLRGLGNIPCRRL
jgi:hypothetical protein